jgi:3D (Asp-Asp-Asp) domain-containing protein
MRNLVLLGMAALLAGCATRPLPKYERPLAKTQFQTVRTTAYTHTESDHLQYANRNALGTVLCCGKMNSAAADWSRWPAGTVFKVTETGELYRVDDYGWALSGRNTIDLYKPTRLAMNRWGVRNVNIEVLQWGDINYSYQVLKPRARYPHVERMLREMRGTEIKS